MKNTSHQQKSQNNSILPLVHYEDGVKKEKSGVLDQIQESEVVKEFTILKTSNVSLEFKKLSKSKQSVTPESAPIIKKKTLKDKSTCLKQNIQKEKLLKTLVLDSTGIDKDLDLFWNKYTQAMSKQLWLPTKTEFVDLDLNSLNGFSTNMILNSWFSVQIMTSKTCLKNSQKIYLQSLLSLLQDTMDKEHLILKNNENLLKTNKETAKQKRLLNYQKKYEETLKVETPDEKIIRERKELSKKILNEKKEANKLKKLLKIKEKNPAYEEIPKDSPGKAKKIRIYPTIEQKQTLNKWFGCRRWIYNKCLYYYKTTYKNENRKPKLQELRDKFIKDANYEIENTWMLDYEFDLRDEALRDLMKNIKSNEEKENNKNFDIKFKSKKDKKESISVLNKKWNKKTSFYASIFNKHTLKCSKNDKDLIPKELKYDSRLFKTPLNKYYLSIPEALVIGENQAKNKIIFIDPGQSTFITGYDPSGKIITIGEKDIGRICRLQHYKNKLQGRIEKEVVKHKRYKMRKALLSINENIKNLVDDFHKKTTKFLTSNYNNIFIPKLNFHKCKKLNTKDKQKMASLRLCELVDRLIMKTREIKNCKVEIVNEAFTTKTCSNCGEQKETINRNRVYECNKCGLSIDRDINASKNIMLRYFSKRVIVKESSKKVIIV